MSTKANDINAKVIAIAALKRIARKPAPATHKRIQEWQKKGGSGIILVHEGHKPPVPVDCELNPCDCSKCVATNALKEMQETLEG